MPLFKIEIIQRSKQNFLNIMVGNQSRGSRRWGGGVVSPDILIYDCLHLKNSQSIKMVSISLQFS